ncbi:unnamed protein product, partial [Symbiodinium pilosum]
EGQLLLLDPPHWMKRPEKLRVAALYAPLRAFLARTKPMHPVDKVVAYERVVGTTSTGRLLEKAQFKRLLELASEALRAVGKASDSIVVYSGKQRNSLEMMSFEQQYRLFNSAYLLFGPHGAGMANSLWMQTADCVQRPAVIEFICSTDTSNVRGCYVYQGTQKLIRPQSFWRLFGGAYWVRYYHVWMLRLNDRNGDVASVDEDGFNMS